MNGAPLPGPPRANGCDVAHLFREPRVLHALLIDELLDESTGVRLLASALFCWRRVECGLREPQLCGR